MRSCAKTFAGSLVLVTLVAPALRAQTPAGLRYQAIREDEQIVSGSPAATAADFRYVVERYWRLVQRYPLNGYVTTPLAGGIWRWRLPRFGATKIGDSLGMFTG